MAIALLLPGCAAALDTTIWLVQMNPMCNMMYTGALYTPCLAAIALELVPRCQVDLLAAVL